MVENSWARMTVSRLMVNTLLCAVSWQRLHTVWQSMKHPNHGFSSTDISLMWTLVIVIYTNLLQIGNLLPKCLMEWTLNVFLKMNTNSYLNSTDKISSSPAAEGKDVLVSVVVLFTVPSLSCLFLWFSTDSIDFVFIFVSYHVFCRPFSLFISGWMCLLRTLVKGILPITAVCTAGYQCWSWLIVLQAGGMHQEEHRSIIKCFSKLWLRFLFLLKNKVCCENLTLV